MAASGLTRHLWRPLARAEDVIDGLRRALSRREVARAAIHPYFGFGTPERLFVQARVLRGPAPILPHPVEVGPAGDEALAGHEERLEAMMRQSRRQTLARMWQRFETDEVAGAAVEVEGLGEVFSDEEGYVAAALAGDAGRPREADPRWRDVYMRLTEGERPEADAACAVMVPGADARFAVVSDIDDTIVRTGATSLRRMLPLVLTTPATGREPFPGVAAFYKALERGGMIEGGTLNPVFYVSSSPWNLYDLLVDYMAIQSIPLGPIFLRDFGLTRHGPVGEGHEGHKGKAIARLLDAYPDLPFVLVGDSGERDPVIYADTVEAYPGRVRAVYLRAVTEDSAAGAAEAVLRIEAAGVPVKLAPETAAMAEHAVGLGLIEQRDVSEVRAVSAAHGGGRA